jgi:hypothetical protein
VVTAAQVNHLPIIARYARRLGLVLLISRLIWRRLIEHAMHTDLAARHTTLPGWDKMHGYKCLSL